MKVFTIIGNRPQFIKAAAVSYAFAQQKGIQETLLHTGQHFDSNMSDVFFRELNIPIPAYNLGIRGSLHGAMTAAQLAGIENVLLKETPDYVLVFGDTNSTLAGALAAAKLNIPVFHVEAGLRSFNRDMPEEINRILTDHISDLLFAPTQAAMKNLAREGIPAEKCHRVGDVMFDAALFFGMRAKKTSDILPKLGIQDRDYVLITIHRAENTNDTSRLRIILAAIEKLSRVLYIVWPLHPRTRDLIHRHNLESFLADNISIIDPVGYLDMIVLEQNASVIATDSGGVQKEAFFYNVPCVTLRSETEWVELVESGWNRVIPPIDDETIVRAVLEAIGTTGQSVNPYGDGNASKRIVEIVSNLSH